MKARGDDCNLCDCAEGKWVCTENTCVHPVCPPMQPDPASCPGPMFTRDPETSGCCRYENACSTPGPEWLAFYSSQVGCESLPVPHCTAGTRVPAGDGCNDCTCTADGNFWDCTSRDCGAPAPTGKACGYWEGGCSAGEYCAFNPAEACSSFDAPSVCRPLPTTCTEDDAPVCGCDGKTYRNRCVAAQGGTGIRDVGACPPPREEHFCGGPAGDHCAPDEYCPYQNWEGVGPASSVDANCGALGGSEIRCAIRPTACVDQLSPVCGCDEKTYGNACLAAKAGVSVLSSGMCP